MAGNGSLAWRENMTERKSEIRGKEASDGDFKITIRE
jgi:hypothetical protein